MSSKKEKLKLVNEHHNTKATLYIIRQTVDSFWLSKEQMTSARKKLCGNVPCRSSNDLGEYPHKHQVIRKMLNGRFVLVQG